MEYEYKVEKSDSFYNDHGFRHFKHKRLIIAISNFYIKTFDIDTKQFTCANELKQVAYHDLKHINAFYDEYQKGIVIDVENKQYAYTSEFPHSIYEIDGNMITHCIDDDKIYVFYSYTNDYQTGLFVFDIKNNTYENVNDDFWYDKDIASCGIFGDKLLIKVDNYIYNYHDKEEILDLSKDIFKYNYNDIIIYGDKLLVGDYKCADIYDLNTKCRCKRVELEGNYNYVRFWDIYNDTLVLIYATCVINLTLQIYIIKI